MDREHGVNEMEDLRDLYISKTLASQGIEPNGGGGFKL